MTRNFFDAEEGRASFVVCLWPVTIRRYKDLHVIRIARFVAIAAAISCGCTTSIFAQQSGYRQYYGNWQSHPAGYAYRPYYYKPSSNYAGYKHHYVIHHPRDPEHNYFFNPYTKKFWGRCPTSYGTQPQYSMLAEKDRQEDLEKIAPTAFPKPGPLPPIPDSNDGVTLDLPPDDLPNLNQLPANSRR